MAIGEGSQANSGSASVSIGNNARCLSGEGVAIGFGANANGTPMEEFIALGAKAT